MQSTYGNMSKFDKAWGTSVFSILICALLCPFIQNEYLECAKHCVKH